MFVAVSARARDAEAVEAISEQELALGLRICLIHVFQL